MVEVEGSLMSMERSFHSIDGCINCSLEPCCEGILSDSTRCLLTYEPWRRHDLWHNQSFCLWLCWSWEHRSGAQQWGRGARPKGSLCLISSTTLSTPREEDYSTKPSHECPQGQCDSTLNLLRLVLGFWQRAPASSDPMFALSNMLGSDEGQCLRHGESLPDT